MTEEHRRRGIGRALLEAMRESTTERFAAGGQRFRFPHLFMERGNQMARRFRRRMGFREACTILSIYPHGDACVWTQSVMGKVQHTKDGAAFAALVGRAILESGRFSVNDRLSVHRHTVERATCALELENR